MCVLLIKVPIGKKPGNLFNDLPVYIYIYISILVVLFIFLVHIYEHLIKGYIYFQVSDYYFGT